MSGVSDSAGSGRTGGVEPATIAYWYTTGKISVRKTGKIIRIPREAFEQWLLKREGKRGWYSMGFDTEEK